MVCNEGGITMKLSKQQIEVKKKELQELIEITNVKLEWYEYLYAELMKEE